MAKKKKRKKSGDPIAGIILIVLALLVGISIYSYNPLIDSGILDRIFGARSLADILDVRVANAGGIVGAFVAFIIMTVLGKFGWVVPPLILLSGVYVFSGKGKWYLPYRIRLTALALLLLSIIFTIPTAGGAYSEADGYGFGGAFGYILAKVFRLVMGTTGSYIILGAGFCVIAGFIFPVFAKKVFWKIYGFITGFFKGLWKILSGIPGMVVSLSGRIFKSKEKAKIKIVKPKQETPVVEPQEPPPPVSVNIRREQVDEPEEGTEEEPRVRASSEGTFTFPEMSLLDRPERDRDHESDEEIKQKAETLKETLSTFGVRINEGSLESYPGPVITRFEFQPAPGIKVSQINSLADDLALAMKAKSIRVIAPIPGKGTVGIEIPNNNPQVVHISEVLGSSAFRASDYLIPLALGKDTGGQPFIADLARMPHLLIAGATGQGKSVCLNTIITSIIYKLHPDEIRFIFIDPKRLELSVYSGIPHLERPVVTKARQAERVLKDAVEEMENRYGNLAELGVRNIEDFNNKVDDEEKLPYIIIIVDELADLMVGSSNKIELMITRLAQMARAVGIHLVLATQRPSVDVITGLIKANFSSRIAFKVASKIDSRTILDANGADKLLGKGDMLIMLTGQQDLIRVHGSYVSGEETARIVETMRDNEYKPKPVETLQPGGEIKKDSSVLSDASDELFREAAETVVLHKQGSVSLLQRRLGVGYQRAARLIDSLEAAGVVGPYDGSKARKVLVNQQYLKTLFEKQGHANK
ncbi:MAG: DNA translocase FtsK [candidate division Zixibacteria bacterium]|nr:DNA translocase FtsK [candidate division Zixibacteria bacterium]